MTTKTKARKGIEQHRPERPLAEFAVELRSTGKGAVAKQFTGIGKTASEDGSVGGIFRPTDEQLAKINQFTRTPKTAEEVVCFRTLSCNDMVDRDTDRFTADCITDFAKLEGDFSSVGKSFMVGHDYDKLPVGRIFDVDTTKVGDANFLTNDVFMPNTEQYKSFIENMDFGIYWAVSVGVMLGEQNCSICGYEMRGFGRWAFCMSVGHEKGLYYDPESKKVDDWGYALPISPDDANAVLCVREFSSPVDYYELSQVFLGAQYGAQLERGVMKGAFKDMETNKLPMSNLGVDLAKELPIPHAPDEVREAFLKGFVVRHTEDGTVQWTDGSDLVWEFDPSESEVLCLGQSTDDDEQEVTNGEESREPDGKGGGSGESDDGSASGDGGSNGVEDGSGQSDSEDGERADDADGSDANGVAVEESADDDTDDESDEDDDSEDDESDEDEDEDAEDEVESEKAVVRAAVRAKLPREVVSAAEKAKDGKELETLLSATSKHIAGLRKQNKALEHKAALGEKFVEDKRSEAIAWYVRNKQAGTKKGVKTETFVKMLDRLGDDIELLDEVIQEHKEAAQAKFPSSVRRSTEPVDPHSKEELEPVPLDKRAAEKVRNAHG